ncbi:MAG: nucleoside triphosphate pyrophosphohydrolase [Bacillota bacterium]
MAARQIIICGLGPGNREAIPVGVIEMLRQTGIIFLRTGKHPVVPFLQGEGIRFETFDRFYEEEISLETVYHRIATAVLEAANGAGGETKSRIVYGVPGHPLVTEEPSRLIIEKAESEALEVNVLPAMSFIEAIYVSLRLDPVRGMTILDGLGLNPDRVCTSLPAIVMQVLNRTVASEVMLFLKEYYPGDHPVTVIRAASVPGQEKRADVPLCRLDTPPWFDHLTSVYLPPLAALTKKPGSFVLSRRKQAAPEPGKVSKIFTAAGPRRPGDAPALMELFLEMIAALRGENGCPWDKEQTHQTLKKYLVEEAYEVLDAIERGKPHNLCEELGDLLLQIVLHCQIASEADHFVFADVVQAISQKMIFRHPHVFGETKVQNSQEVAVNWERLKKVEKPDAVMFDGIPRSLPALLRAIRVQEKAARVGFDWPDWRGAMTKVQEEAAELAAVMETPEKMESELGDLIFAVVNVIRLQGMDPEEVLNKTTEKFIRRFNYIERRTREKGLELKDVDLRQMDEWWEEAKVLESHGNL